MRTRHKLHCASCTRKPLLAYYGLDDRGELYVHMKVFKQGRIFGEVVHRGGVVSLRCRECRRWTTVRLNPAGTAVSEPESPAPAEAPETGANCTSQETESRMR